MVATMNETDIDRFIREQKSKLVNERNNLGILIPDENNGIWKLGQYENHRKKLQEERHTEYKNHLQNQEFLKKDPKLVGRKFQEEEERNVHLIEEQLKELQARSHDKFLTDSKKSQKTNENSFSEIHEEKKLKKGEKKDFFDNFGEYENKKKKLKEERERDLKRHLAQNSTKDDLLLRNAKPLTSHENHIIWADQRYEDRNPPLLYRGPVYNPDYPSSRLKSTASEKALNRYDMDLKDLANEYSARLSQPNLHEEIENRLRPMPVPSTLPPVSDNFLDDPLWARLREENPNKLGYPPSRSTSWVPDDYLKRAALDHEGMKTQMGHTSTNQQQFIKEPTYKTHDYLPEKKSEVYATLPIGKDEEIIKQRQKHNYREELQKQIRERNEMRLREKQLDQAPEETPLIFRHHKKKPYPLPQPELELKHRSKSMDAKQFDSYQSRSDLNYEFMGQTFDQNQSHLYSNDFKSNLTFDPLIFDAQNNSIDKAYTFYGMKSHFDDIPSTNDFGSLTPPLKKAKEPKYVPETSYPRGSAPKSAVNLGPSAMVFGNDESRTTVRKRDQEYMKDLERQMQEKKMQKLKAKQEQERFDRRLEEENKQYNPYGRGGGGAPLKDSSGNVLANLRHMKQNVFELSPLNADLASSPSAALTSPFSNGPPLVQQGQQPHPAASPPKPHMQMDKENYLASLADLSDEPTHARGGHGIFGEPKTDAQKTATDKYREELQKQMIDKRKQKLAEAEKERLEEEKVNKRLEEERKKMQEEFEEEERKKKAKLEEEKKAEAEMRKQIEEKRQAAEKLRKEQEEKQEMEKKNQEKMKDSIPIDRNRPKSPPVPALQRKINSESRTSARQELSPAELIQSPPVQLRAKETNQQEAKPPLSPKSRAQSADVLKQLKVLRKGLQQKYMESEMRRHSSTQLLEPPTDALINQKAVLLRRGSHNIQEPSISTNSDVLHDFNQLKYRKQTGSRNAFRNQYPECPLDLDTLELQQRALINHQEKTLQQIRQNGPFKGTNEHEHPPLLRQKTVSPQPMLDSKSSFFDADSMPLLSDMFSDKRIPKTESARSRRRRRLQSPLLAPLDNISLRSNSAGSIASLNPDKIAKKNEVRLKKLQIMSDAVSLTEPEDILDRFMSKQDRKSPPSSVFDGFN